MDRNKAMRDRRAHAMLAGVAFLFAALAGPAWAGDRATADPVAGPVPAARVFTSQLPRGARPVHYAVTLKPDLRALRFDGRVEIDVAVEKPLSALTLNALDLKIAGATIDGRPVRVDSDEAAQTITLVPEGALAVGRHTVTIDYAGGIGTQAAGMFALDYGIGAGARRALYTQFEAADARRVIPSWDEPAYKASFTLHVELDDRDGVPVSNMPLVARTSIGQGRARYGFATSPVMSTYLLFLAVGDFERQAMAVGATETAVVTRRGDLPKAAEALRSSAAVLAWYTDYFGIPYPLPKLDHVAAPGGSQFFSAMENWGAIFYFEHALLVDPALSNTADRERIFEVVAHEIAHQWFGNLVTMGWWEDLWLNEGFASWLETKATARFHPEWRPDMGSVMVRERAIGLDAMASTHPIVQPIASPDAMGQAFDSITYAKGESVVGMLEAYVGPAAWQAGVRRYLRSHAYGNTVTNDLWAAVEAESGKPVTGIAHQFTTQPGVPLIRVERARCSAGRTRLRLAQGEFTVDRPGKAPLRWQVPVVATAGGATTTFLATGARTEATLEGCGPVVVNHGQTGYFRTLYAPAAFAALVRGYAGLSDVDRLGILVDGWALGLAGLQPVTDALDLIEMLPADGDDQLWTRAAGMLGAIAGFSGDNKRRRAAVRAYASRRFGPRLAALGWDDRPGDSDIRSSLRSRLISVLGDLGDPAVVAEARRRFAADASDPIPAAQRKAILDVVAANADQATWDQLHALARNGKVPLQRSEYYRLLARPKDVGLARAALALALGDEPGATDCAAMIATVAARYPELAFDFATAHRAAVEARVDANSRLRFIAGLASQSSDARLLERLGAWVTANVPAEVRRAADASIATVRYRVMIRAKRLPAIDAWLARKGASIP